ncbi:MAG: TonB-dependent receptor [Verrucomicrobia bacterium]|nr:TonB-dependent receptor [Verrucomicrobiota bacterium]
MHPDTTTNLLRRVCSALAGLFLLTSVALAQGSTGTIEGRVLNATNGSYLFNARVVVEGTALQTLTDAAGSYRLDGVPSGTARVRVFYTGLPEQTLTVAVTAGQSTTRDVNLGAASDAATGGEVLKLDAFTVAAQREMDAAAIAINEQRFAANIKNVVNTDAFGDIAEGNIGDFVKFLPGVTIDYVSPDARTISVRGVAANYTPITINGNPMASANSSNAGRTQELEQVSLNNASRIEVFKSRTPDVAANALGGSVNLVPRSAFERSRPSLNYRVFLSANGDEKELGKTRGPTNEASRKVKPGFDLVYTRPVTKNFGFTLSLLESNIYYPQHRSQPNWGPTTGAQAGATGDHPFLRQYQVQDGPKNNRRDSVGTTLDWRFTPQDVLSADFQWSYYDASFSNRPVTYTIGNVQPASADLVNGTFVHGANGAGTLNLNTSFRRKYGYTYQPQVSWRHTGPIWRLDGGLSFSHATNHYHDYQDSHFENVQINLRGNPAGNAINAATVWFDDLDKGSYLVPRISVYNNTGTTAINLADPVNYNVGTAGTNPADSVDTFKTLRFNARRELNFSVPVAFKTGLQITEQVRDIRKDNPGARTFVGPDRTANTADDRLSLYDLIDPQYSSGPYLFGTPRVPSPDPYRYWKLYREHPEYFAEPSGATLIQNMSTNNLWFKERISAAYLMADARFVNNRLRAVTGVRYEKTEDEAQGPTNNLNAAKGITDPVAAAAARYGIRKLVTNRNYDGFYPSLDLSFNVTPELVARAAVTRSIGRPDMNLIIPSLSVPDTTATSGTISVNNAGLEPTQTKAYDLALEYYFSKTGVFSVGAFRKDFSNFTGTLTQPATAALLASLDVPEPQLYANGLFNVSSRFNVGDAQVTGVEFNYSQVLSGRWLPDWANNKFTVYANGQKMHLDGSTLADFSNFIRESGSWGVKYGVPKFNAQVNFNYRGRQRLGAQTVTINGVARNDLGYYDYFKPRVYIDANFEYRYSPKLGVFLNARNLTNVAQDIQRYAPVITPSWSRTYRREEFGVQYTVGIKGTF